MSQTLKFCIASLPTDFLISGSSLLLTESILHTRYCKSAGTEHILGQVNIEREKKKKNMLATSQVPADFTAVTYVAITIFIC